MRCTEKDERRKNRMKRREIDHEDGNSRVACEVTCVRDFIHIFGEVTSSAQIDYDAIARRVISEIGYTRSGQGFDADTCRIRVDLHEQSPDIARGIDRRLSLERMNSGLSLEQAD